MKTVVKIVVEAIVASAIINEVHKIHEMEKQVEEIKDKVEFM